MWNLLLVSWNTMCAAVGVAYTDVASFASLLYTDITSLFIQIHGGVLASGAYAQNFGAAALKAWGGV